MRGTSGKTILSLVILLTVAISLVPWKGQTETDTLQITQTIGPIPTTVSPQPGLTWEDITLILLIVVVILLTLGLARLWTILKRQK